MKKTAIVATLVEGNVLVPKPGRMILIPISRIVVVEEETELTSLIVIQTSETTTVCKLVYHAFSDIVEWLAQTE